MSSCFIGLGSNMQQPLQQLNNARRAMQALPQTRIVASSSIYQSPALTLDDEPQDDYLNAVVELDTGLQPEDLLDALQQIENAQGRTREKRWGARSIDLDILLYDDRTIHSERLTVPHSEMLNRSFVLLPLYEIAPEIRVPGSQDLKSLMSKRVDEPLKVVGKTTLAKKLAHSFGSELLLEGAAENPFMQRFYENPKAAALSTQLFFLLQRARQMQDLRQQDMFNPVRIADFLMEKDRLFAELTLDDDELKLYEQVYDQLTFDVPQPDLVVYLQAPVEVLLDRIENRGIYHERLIESSYLQRLSDAYVEFFYHYTDAPLLIVNATEVDFANNENDYQQLLQRLNSITSGRHFYNPNPELI